jgi:hypothetical protein
MLEGGSGKPIVLAGGHLACPTAATPGHSASGFPGWSANVPFLNAFMQVGAFGADRNRDGSLTIGDVPASARMLASEVARFNFYDPVCWVRFGR